MSQWDGTMPHNSQETVVVPREPTEAMQNVGVDTATGLFESWVDEGQVSALYRAMISAAPASPDPLLEEAVGLLEKAQYGFSRTSLLGFDVRAFLAKLGRA